MHSQVAWRVALLFVVLFFVGAARAADPGTGSDLDRVARWPHGPSHAVHAAADLLLVGEGSLLRTYDPTDPMRPVALGLVELPGVVLEIARVGDLAYCAAARGGLRIVDVSDPSQPALRGGYFTPGTAYAVAVVEDRVVVGDEVGGLRIVDASDPDAPFEVGAYTGDLYAMDVELVGSTAYVADMVDAALEVYDVADPSNVVLLASEGVSGPPWGVSVDGALAVVVDDYAGITTFDVSTPSAPVETGHAWMDDVGFEVELHGTVATVAEDWRGLTVYDLSSLPSITRTCIHDTSGYAFGVGVRGDVVYVADTQGGVLPVDVSVPAAPVAGDAIAPFGPVRRVHTEGGVSYAIDEFHGLRILQPLAGGDVLEVGAVALDGSPQRIAIDGDVAYVACSTADVAVIDVADPRHPAFLRSIDLPDYVQASRAMSVAVEGDRLAVVDRTSGFLLYDVSDPLAPVEIGSAYMNTRPRDLVLDGDYAYVADENESIRVIALTPVVEEVARASHAGYNYDLDLHGSILFVAKDWRGVWMLDVSDPLSPIDVYAFSTVGSASDLSVAWPYLYVAEGSAVRVYDVGFPTSPVLAGEYVVDDVTLGVCASRQWVHVGGMKGGWYELENSLLATDVDDRTPAAGHLAVEPPFPNPFNPISTLRFAVARPGPVRVSVVDARGRTVAVLLDEPLGPGPHEVSWDGRDTRGLGVASGTYRYRVEADGRVQTRSGVLVR